MRMSRRHMLAIVALSALACTDPSASDPGSSARNKNESGSLFIRPQLDTVAVGDTVYFYADVPDSVVDGWTISDSSVARILAQSQAGVSLVALDSGTVTLKVTKGQEWGQAVLVALPSYQRDTSVARVTIGGCPPRLAVGDSLIIGWNAWDAYGNVVFGHAPTFTFSNQHVAEVFKMHEQYDWLPWVRGLETGGTDFIITVDGKTACVHLVFGENVPPEYDVCGQHLAPVATASIWFTNLSPDTAAQAQQPIGIEVTLRDAQGNHVVCRPIDWSVSDTSLMKIYEVYRDGSGVAAETLRPGTVTVTATSEGKSGSKTIMIR